MRHESLGKLSFNPQYLGRLIDVFLATDIAPDFEGVPDGRARDDCIRLGQQDFMAINKVARNMVKVVLAGHDPEVGTIFPHGLLSSRPHVAAGKPVKRFGVIQTDFPGKNNTAFGI
jgi:hypothetical protein